MIITKTDRAEPFFALLKMEKSDIVLLSRSRPLLCQCSSFFYMENYSKFNSKAKWLPISYLDVKNIGGWIKFTIMNYIKVPISIADPPIVWVFITCIGTSILLQVYHFHAYNSPLRFLLCRWSWNIHKQNAHLYTQIQNRHSSTPAEHWTHEAHMLTTTPRWSSNIVTSIFIVVSVIKAWRVKINSLFYLPTYL